MSETGEERKYMKETLTLRISMCISLPKLNNLQTKKMVGARTEGENESAP